MSAGGQHIQVVKNVWQRMLLKPRLPQLILKKSNIEIMHETNILSNRDIIDVMRQNANSCFDLPLDLSCLKWQYGRWHEPLLKNGQSIFLK